MTTNLSIGKGEKYAIINAGLAASVAGLAVSVAGLAAGVAGITS